MSQGAIDGPAKQATERDVPFDEALAALVRQAERDGVELSLPRDVDAVGSGTWMVEISRVQSDPERF